MIADRHRLIADALGRSPRTILEIDDGYDFEVAIVDDDWVFRFPRRAGVEEALGLVQADVLRIPVEVAAEREATAIGAAALAGLAVGVFTSKDEVARALGTAKRYVPQLDEDEAERLVREWRRAVKNALE